MNKKILTISGVGSGIAAVLLVLAVTTLDSSMQTQEFVLSEPILPEATLNTVEETPLTVPPRPIMKLITHPVKDIQMAKSMIQKFDVIAPIIPKGYSIQGLSADSESGTFKMLLSEVEVTSSTTFLQFYDNGGILIFIEDQSDGNIDKDSWIESRIAHEGTEELTIDGKAGIIRDIMRTSFIDGSELTDPAKLVFYDGDVLYKVQGIINANDLVRLAESLD